MSQWWPSTALSCRKGITVKAPPKVSRPALRPSQKISAVSETVTAPASERSGRAGASENECDRCIQRSAFVQSS